MFAQIDSQIQRLEILDWYHLVENLGKVGGSQQRLDAVEACLWQGDIEGAVKQFDDWSHERVDRFIAYLAKHRHRITCGWLRITDAGLSVFDRLRWAASYAEDSIETI